MTYKERQENRKLRTKLNTRRDQGEEDSVIRNGRISKVKDPFEVEEQRAKVEKRQQKSKQFPGAFICKSTVAQNARIYTLGPENHRSDAMSSRRNNLVSLQVSKADSSSPRRRSKTPCTVHREADDIIETTKPESTGRYEPESVGYIKPESTSFISENKT